MWPTFARRVCDIYAHVRCVFAARVERSKVWAHITILSDTIVTCNILGLHDIGKNSHCDILYFCDIYCDIYKKKTPDDLKSSIWEKNNQLLG